MPRPEAWRLDPASYPHSEPIQTRFQDLDVLGHLNNVAMAALFESGRVRFNRSMNLAGWAGHRWLVARVEINYLGEGFFPAMSRSPPASVKSAIAAGKSCPLRSRRENRSRRATSSS